MGGLRVIGSCDAGTWALRVFERRVVTFFAAIMMEEDEWRIIGDERVNRQ